MSVSISSLGCDWGKLRFSLKTSLVLLHINLQSLKGWELRQIECDFVHKMSKLIAKLPDAHERNDVEYRMNSPTEKKETKHLFYARKIFFITSA